MRFPFHFPSRRFYRQKSREFYRIDIAEGRGAVSGCSSRGHTPKKARYRNQRSVLILLFCVFLLLLAAAITLFAGSRRPAKDSNSIIFDPEPESETQISSSAENEEESTVSPDDPRLLMLVNASHPIPEDYEIDPVVLRYGMVVDRLCYKDLQAMMDDCRAAGLKPLICSAYRTVEKQQELFDAKVSEFMLTGLSLAEAEKKAAAIVACPGTSEHHTGLALDIVDESYQLLEPEQERTAVSRWLTVHAWEYGFIIRYPVEKTNETGVIYEPWHYRYVGRELAKEITESGLCLEEYCGGPAG